MDHAAAVGERPGTSAPMQYPAQAAKVLSRNVHNIACPKCGTEIPLSEAVSHGLREELAATFERERAEAAGAIKRREEKLLSEAANLDKRAREIESEVARQLDSERRKLLQEAAEKAGARLGAEMKDLQNQLAEKNEKLQTAEAAELDLRKKQRELEESRASLELEVARKLDEERKKIADTARQQAVEAERLKLADKDGLIKGLQEQIAALQQRAEQGSMQLQGETLELELEQHLRATFPFDEIAEVKKGQRGADVTQRVRTSAGGDCGSILWETKRARNWSAVSPRWTEYGSATRFLPSHSPRRCGRGLLAPPPSACNQPDAQTRWPLFTITYAALHSGNTSRPWSNPSSA
jgi:hypothetical protein